MFWTIVFALLFVFYGIPALLILSPLILILFLFAVALIAFLLLTSSDRGQEFVWIIIFIVVFGYLKDWWEKKQRKEKFTVSKLWQEKESRNFLLLFFGASLLIASIFYLDTTQKQDYQECKDNAYKLSLYEIKNFSGTDVFKEDNPQKEYVRCLQKKGLNVEKSPNWWD